MRTPTPSAYTYTYCVHLHLVRTTRCLWIAACCSPLTTYYLQLLLGARIPLVTTLPTSTAYHIQVRLHALQGLTLLVLAQRAHKQPSVLPSGQVNMTLPYDSTI